MVVPLIIVSSLISISLIATFFVLLFACSDEMPSLKVFLNTIGRDFKLSMIFFKIFSFIKKCHRKKATPLSMFNDLVKKHKDRVCFVYEDEEWTYGMVEDFSNKIANIFSSLGYSKGDEVALYMENCPEFVCLWLGMAKIGVVTALINTNQQGESLSHSINVIETKAVIFGSSLADAVKDVVLSLKNKETLDFFCYAGKYMSREEVCFPTESLNSLLEQASSKPVDPNHHKISFQDKLLYIYTSGTTGFPKAAIIRHNRLLWTAAASKYCCNLGEDEVFYNPLPMYHTAGGLFFVSVCLLFGGKMIIRKKFSASNYWKDAVQHKATIGQYIGEICRYLLNQPRVEEETQHSLRLLFGNGLKPHLWQEFQDRFRIPRIVEIYGATEGNANIVNAFGKVGAVGFIPRTFRHLYPISLIRVDPETRIPVRNSKGLCIRCKPGEPGEVVGKIINNGYNNFDGYANKDDTNKKIIKDCFTKGDLAFLSGDILVMDEEGYLYFMDRTGDTFRWRGENVSSGQVENVFSKALGHAACVVYGVEIPNTEGRAGMATIQSTVENIQFSKLYNDTSKSLPLYAMPVFIRISADIEATGTYKLRKVSVQKEGYNPEEITDPLFFLDRKKQTYVPFTKEMHSDLVKGVIKL